jgi:3-phenylpropionate/trans-cinnamate dioxygenase ferredoxin reductase subunit
VGGGLAGAKAAETLRGEGFTGRVVLIGDETERPYERPPLSKDYLLGKAERDSIYVHPADWYEGNDVSLRLRTTVTGLDRAAHEVTLDDGSRLGYAKLLLTTGSSPRRLDVPGGPLDGVHYLRRASDSDQIKEAFRAASRVAVIGAGWIGLETAAAARSHGAEVTVVEIDSLPLHRVLGTEVGQVFADLHRSHGVEFRFGAQVAEFVGGGGLLTSVRLADGTELPADLAIVAVGIRPNTELAETAGLVVGDGITVDAALRTSDPDIYACGDVAYMENPLLNRSIRVEHWANALDGGPAAAKAMLGQDIVYDKVPYFFTDQYDLGMEYAGYVEPGEHDQVVFRGDVAAREFIAFWVKDGRVLAGMNVNVWDVQDDIQALVRAGYAGKAVDLSRLADPEVPLGDLVS